MGTAAVIVQQLFGGSGSLIRIGIVVGNETVGQVIGTGGDFTVSRITAANACTIFATGGYHFCIVADCNIAARPFLSAANACAGGAAVGIYFCIAADCNITARPVISAANACAGGGYPPRKR